MVGLLHAAAASGGPRGAPVARLAASQWCHLAQPQQGLFSSSEPPRPVVGGGAASSSQSSRAACPPHGGPALCVHPHAECASVQRPCSSRSGALPGPRDSRPHSCAARGPTWWDAALVDCQRFSSVRSLPPWFQPARGQGAHPPAASAGVMLCGRCGALLRTCSVCCTLPHDTAWLPPRGTPGGVGRGFCPHQPAAPLERLPPWSGCPCTACLWEP